MDGAKNTNSQKILIVDGEDFVRNVIKKAFLIESYFVDAVDSAKFTLEILKRDIFDLIIGDHDLHDISGIKFFLLVGTLNR